MINGEPIYVYDTNNNYDNELIITIADKIGITVILFKTFGTYLIDKYDCTFSISVKDIIAASNID